MHHGAWGTVFFCYAAGHVGIVGRIRHGMGGGNAAAGGAHHVRARWGGAFTSSHAGSKAWRAGKQRVAVGAVFVSCAIT